MFQPQMTALVIVEDKTADLQWLSWLFCCCIGSKLENDSGCSLLLNE